MVSPGEGIAGSAIVDEAQALLGMSPMAPETCPVVRPCPATTEHRVNWALIVTDELVPAAA